MGSQDLRPGQGPTGRGQLWPDIYFGLFGSHSVYEFLAYGAKSNAPNRPKCCKFTHGLRSEEGRHAKGPPPRPPPPGGGSPLPGPLPKASAEAEAPLLKRVHTPTERSADFAFSHRQQQSVPARSELCVSDLSTFSRMNSVRAGAPRCCVKMYTEQRGVPARTEMIRL